MVITESLVLPADVLMVPVEQLPQETRAALECGAGDYALTRPRARTPAKVIDADAAALLKQFQSPKTIVQAVIGYSRTAQADPQETLESAYPFLRALVLSALLVDSDSRDAERIVQSLDFGDRVGDYRVLYCIQVLEDTELYQVKRPGEPHAALKILRSTAGPAAGRMLARESEILSRLDGAVSPALLETRRHGDSTYLVIGWCVGIDVAAAAAEYRAAGDAAGQQALLALCTSVLETYSYLHAQGVIHGDVHPRNVLVDGEGCVQIVDFGLARLAGPDRTLDHAERGGVGFFFEPEYVDAVLARRRPPRANALGEQYALAALLYHLLTGAHYLDFSLERDVMLRQIVDERPVPFAHWEAALGPEVERVVTKALSKAPEDRFSSVDAFARAFGEAALRDGAASAAFEATVPVPVCAAHRPRAPQRRSCGTS